MRIETYVCLALVLLILPGGAGADPVQDLSLHQYRAGWYSNLHQDKQLTCPQTCKARVGGLAEYEASPVPPTKRAFLCKVEGTPQEKIRTWLYGNQFDDRPACYTTALNLKGSYSQRYFCLCIPRSRQQ